MTVKVEERPKDAGPKRYPMPDGSEYVVLVSAAETHGERTEMEFTLPPGSVSPPAHVHPRQFDEFEVLEGTLDVLRDGRWRRLAAGESIVVPPGTLHTFRNRGSLPVRARCVHRPAMRFERYLEHIHRLLSERGLNSGKDPRVLVYLCMLALEYRDTVVSARLRERILLRALATVGRLFRMNTKVVGWDA